MQTKNTLFIANWKMQKPFSEALQFCKNHQADIVGLSEKEGVSIAIAPDFVSLDHLVQSFSKTNVNIGAQNCSQYEQGPFTGQVSAQSISDTGADFCIVGHSEVRRNLYCIEPPVSFDKLRTSGRESFFSARPELVEGYERKKINEQVAQSMLRALEENMFPVVCIGETEQEQSNDETFAVLEQQLTPIISAAQNTAPFKITIAYEPIWAIGTGKTPEPSDIANVFLYIKELWEKHMDTPLRLLYGGSVSSKNISQFKSIDLLGGFLIGSASLEFDEFKKIICEFTK